jgi:hypothetical protein
MRVGLFDPSIAQAGNAAVVFMCTHSHKQIIGTFWHVLEGPHPVKLLECCYSCIFRPRSKLTSMRWACWKLCQSIRLPIVPCTPSGGYGLTAGAGREVTANNVRVERVECLAWCRWSCSDSSDECDQHKDPARGGEAHGKDCGGKRRAR